MAYYMDGTTQVWEPDSFDAASSSGMSGLSQFGDLSQQLQQNTLANNVWSAEQAEKVNAFNAEQAALNREFQREMSSSAHQREVADLKAAGLNPVLSARLAGASTPSGSSAQGQKGETDTSLNGALTSLVGAFISQENARLNAQTNLAIAEKNNATSRLVAEIAAMASANSAYIYADASKYGYDLNLTNSREQRSWDAAHPNNLYQLGSDLIGMLGGNSNSGINTLQSLVNSAKSNITLPKLDAWTQRTSTKMANDPAFQEKGLKRLIASLTK